MTAQNPGMAPATPAGRPLVRRPAGRRISGALWGLLVTGAGVLLIASLSGFELDFELAAILVLAALGGWLLLSAAVSGIGRKREIAYATSPTVEETVEQTIEETVEDTADEAMADVDAAVTEATDSVDGAVTSLDDPATTDDEDEPRP